MKKALDNILKITLKRCFDDGSLKETPLPKYVIEVPNNSEHGHFATNLPLTLASSQRRRPSDIAAVIVDKLEDPEAVIEKSEIAGPGFINFTIKNQEWYRLLTLIAESGQDYGRSDLGQHRKIMLEYVLSLIHISEPTRPY